MIRPDPKPAGTWDFYGFHAPSELGNGTYSFVLNRTFTLGCFQWVPYAFGKGTKPGKVQHRIKGRSDDPAPAFNEARRYCAVQNGQPIK